MNWTIRVIPKTEEGYLSIIPGDIILTNMSSSNMSFLPLDLNDSAQIESLLNCNILNSESLDMMQDVSNKNIDSDGFTLLGYEGNVTTELLGLTLPFIKEQLEYQDIVDINLHKSDIVIGYLTGIDHSGFTNLSELINAHNYSKGLWLVARCNSHLI